MELNKIYNEDCLIGMQRIPDESIDCIICDLPYGTTKNKWDTIIPLDMLWKQYNRIIKNNGAICLFGQMPFTAVLACSNLSMLKYEWIWEKSMATGRLNCNYAPLKAHENILVFSKSSACYVKDKRNAMIFNPQMDIGKPYRCVSGRQSTNYDQRWSKEKLTINNGTRYPRDVKKFSHDKEKIHPTQKPVALLEYLIMTYSIKGGVILDNCMGSGTTAIAAMRTGRNFIGFELNKEYYDKAIERIERERNG